MLHQTGTFSSVFNLDVLFDLSDFLSYFRARPVCGIHTVVKTKQVSGVQLLYFQFERIVLISHSLS
jgi:hypothetical protein